MKLRNRNVASRPLVGIGYICAGAFCLVANDVISKYLETFLPPVQITFFRMLVSLPLIVALGLYVEGPHVFKTNASWIQILRGIAAAAASITYIYGLGRLPVADNAAIGYSAPLFITLLAIPLLGERPTVQRWAAIFVGFVGILFIARPGSGVLSKNVLFPLASAIAYAVLMVNARMLANRGDSIWVTILYSTILPLIICAAFLPWNWVGPARALWPVLFMTGVTGGLAIALITQAFRVTAASVVAPFDYSGLVWEALAGWVFWNQIPSDWSVIGIIIIIATGVYLARTEGTSARAESVPNK